MRTVRLVLLAIILFVVLFAILLMFFAPQADAATNINSPTAEHFAWNEGTGWWDFYTTDSVIVANSELQGYANSSVGDISLNCANTRNGNICSPSNGNYKVENVAGELFGWAWNDVIGWISMNCDQSLHGGTDQCLTSNYGVSIISATGDFQGWAWNDTVGWISFNGCEHGACGTYKVNTLWRAVGVTGTLESSIFDTAVANGATINSITWFGNNPGNGANVEFQVAVSDNPGGPWNWIGPDGTSLTYYAAPCESTIAGGTGVSLPNTPICIDPNQVKDKRYIRYKVRLTSNEFVTESPRVDDIIVNWSY